MATFVLEMAHGPNWDDSRGIREQDGWDAHAAFMDSLVDEGVVVLGGPLGDQGRVMLVVRATDAAEIDGRFAADPWRDTGVLHIGSIEPWTIWLDGTRRASSLASD